MVDSKIPISVNTTQTLDVNNDTYIVDGLAGNITLTMPDVFTTILDGVNFYIIRADTSSNTLTIAPNGAAGNSISGGSPNISISGRTRLRLISLNGVWYGTQIDSATQETKSFSSGGNINGGQSFIGSNGQTSTGQAAAVLMPRATTILSFVGTMNTAIVGTGTITVQIVRYSGSDFTVDPTVIGSIMLDNSNLGTPVQWTGTVTLPNLSQFDSIAIRSMRVGQGTNSKRINVAIDLL